MKIWRLNRLSAALGLVLSTLLSIAMPVAQASGTNYYWCGANNGNFSNSANWNTNSDCSTGTAQVPTNGDNLVFVVTGLSSQRTAHDDANFAVGSVTFSGSNSHNAGFSITGNQISIATGVTDGSGAPNVFTNDVDFGLNQTLNVASGSTLKFTGAISDSKQLTLSGGGTLNLSNSALGSTGVLANFTGSLSSPSSQIILGTYDSFSSAAPVTVSGSGSLVLQNENSSSGNVSFALPLTVGGSTLGSLDVAGASGLGVTLSSALTLTSDTQISQLQGSGMTLNITGHIAANSHNLTSSIAGMTTVTVAQGDNQAAQNPTVGNDVTYSVDGTLGNTIVANGGTLQGTGTVGNLTVTSGGTVAPGHSPGCLNTGNLVLNGSYQIQLGGTPACSGYDQLDVTGTVDVTGATPTVSAYNGFAPQAGQSFTIISNDGSDAVTGTFANLPEGSSFTNGGVLYKVSYKGGDGNDVVLTVAAASTVGAPNTGFHLIAAHPLTSLLVTTLAAGGLIILSRRLQPAKWNR